MAEVIEFARVSFKRKKPKFPKECTHPQLVLDAEHGTVECDAC